MSNFAKNIGEKRTPVTTPAHIVENGVAHYGTFSEPFQDLNLLDCKKPFFMKTPSFIKRMRLIEWEAFEVNMDEGSLISACYNMGPIGFSIFVWHNNADNKIYAWRNLVPVKRAKVAKQLLSDNCYCKTKKSEYKIINDFANGKAQCVGHTKGKSGEFAIDISFERLSPLANGVMPLMKNKDGSFRNPLYSEKDFFKATGTITLNGKTYKTNERSVGIIDDHKGYYPFFSHYDWLTTMGKTEIDGEQKFFAFNLTRNQSVDQVNYNENVIWLEGESFPMPPVVFTHKDGNMCHLPPSAPCAARGRDKGRAQPYREACIAKGCTHGRPNGSKHRKTPLARAQTPQIAVCAPCYSPLHISGRSPGATSIVGSLRASIRLRVFLHILQDFCNIFLSLMP